MSGPGRARSWLHATGRDPVASRVERHSRATSPASRERPGRARPRDLVASPLVSVSADLVANGVWRRRCSSPLEVSAAIVGAGVVVLQLDSIVVVGDTGHMSYPGGKCGSGVYQAIINQMPPHLQYIEPFLGGGAVMRHKRPARMNVGWDLDPDVVVRAADLVGRGEWFLGGPGVVVDHGRCRPRADIRCADAVEQLSMWRWSTDTLVYCDPPYLMSTRRRHRPLYRCELSEEGHRALLRVLLRQQCRVMVSGYASEMYNRALSAWRVVRYWTTNRAGARVEELLWCNFPEPEELHDYRYVGRDYRERERIRRRCSRWVTMLQGMTMLERRALLSTVHELRVRGEL